MSLERINLRKFLRLAMADNRQLTSLLREDIRSERRKENGDSSGGGDFFVPFWAAAKSHAKNQSNLAIEIPKLITANSRRHRLYPVLSSRFLEWWHEKRAWRNEEFQIFDDTIKGHLHVRNLGFTIKIDNIIAGIIGKENHRLVYPYFSETPALSVRGARIGLYLLGQALPEYTIESFRILDVLRSTSYSVTDCPLSGKEEDEISAIYMALLNARNDLRAEYA